MKGLVSGFVGLIPHPSLESRIHGNHQMGALLIFFLDLVKLKKRIMSEGFWFFTLKMTMQSLGNVDFLDR